MTKYDCELAAGYTYKMASNGCAFDNVYLACHSTDLNGFIAAAKATPHIYKLKTL